MVWHSGLTTALWLARADAEAHHAHHLSWRHYQTSLIVAGIDKLDERREVLMAKFLKTCSRQQLSTAQPTPWTTRQWHGLLTACEIQNPFTQSKHVLINS